MYAKKQLIYTVLALIFFFLLGWKTAEYNFADKKPTNISSITKSETTTVVKKVEMPLFWDVWDEMKAYYIDETLVQNDTKLIYGAIKGLVDSLEDPYTVFMDPEETKQFEENLNASLEGIGAELTVEEGFLKVLSPLKNSPAERAGLIPGDIIFQIEGRITGEMTLFDAIMNIRGEKGTDVTLTIIRENLNEPFDVTITRESITIESITYELLEEKIAYISINQFSDDTDGEFDKALQQLMLDVSVDILSRLIEGEKPAVQIQTRDTKKNEFLYLSGVTKLPNLPLVVLVNEGSASAAEILAGAIQDYKRGLILGEKTYGKGSVQEVVYLGDGSSLRMSIAKWLTPEGRNIEKEGITPDRIVEMTYEDALEGNDVQLNEAVEYLLNL